MSIREVIGDHFVSHDDLFIQPAYDEPVYYKNSDDFYREVERLEAEEKAKKLLPPNLNPPMMYRVRLTLWKMEGRSAQEVKMEVCELLRRKPAAFVVVEPLTDNRSFRRKLIFGP